jgi:hypothetical protein
MTPVIVAGICFVSVVIMGCVCYKRGKEVWLDKYMEMREEFLRVKPYEKFYHNKCDEVRAEIKKRDENYDAMATLHNTLVRIRNYMLKLPIRELFPKLDQETANFTRHKDLINPPKRVGAHHIVIQDGEEKIVSRELGKS